MVGEHAVRLLSLIHICNGIHGVPDLIVEVLSHGTEKKDRGYKKDLYEKCGVREYWLVDTENQTVEVYLLKNEKFVLDEVYKVFPDYVELSADEQEHYKSEVPVSDVYKRQAASCGQTACLNPE